MSADEAYITVLERAEAAERKCAELAAALDTIKAANDAPKLNRDAAWANDLSGAINDAVYGSLSVILAAYRAQVERRVLERVENVGKAVIGFYWPAMRDALAHEFAPEGETK